MNATQNSITTTVLTDDIIITIQGNFTFAVYKAFFNAYSQHKNGRNHFILDFSRVDYVDSAGLGMLMKFKEEIDNSARSVTLRGCNDNLKKILNVTRLNDIFRVT